MEEINNYEKAKKDGIILFQGSTFARNEDVLAFLSSFAEKIKEGVEADVSKKIKSWVYGYDSYVTMMNTKKSYDKGWMARELGEELYKLLSSDSQTIKE